MNESTVCCVHNTKRQTHTVISLPVDIAEHVAAKEPLRSLRRKVTIWLSIIRRLKVHEGHGGCPSAVGVWQLYKGIVCQDVVFFSSFWGSSAPKKPKKVYKINTAWGALRSINPAANYCFCSEASTRHTFHFGIRMRHTGRCVWKYILTCR